MIGSNRITFEDDERTASDSEAAVQPSLPTPVEQSEQPQTLADAPQESSPGSGETPVEVPSEEPPATGKPEASDAPSPASSRASSEPSSMPPDTEPVAAARQVLDMQMEHLNRTLEASTKTQEFLSEVNAKLAHERLQAFKIYQSEQDARLEQMKKTMEVQAQQRRAHATTGMEFASEIIARFLSNQMLAFMPKDRK